MALATLISQESCLVGTIVNNNLSTTGLTVDVEFKDAKTGVARTPQSTTLDFLINKDSSKWEHIRATSHSTAGGVTTIVISPTGRAIPKFGTGAGSGTGNSHPIGSQVGEVYTHDQVEQINAILNGTKGSGYNSFRLGDETDSDIYIYAQNADGSKPFLLYDASASQWVFSNDGVSTTDVGGGTGSITAGDGIAIAAGVVSVDLTATPGLEFSGGNLQVKIKTDAGITRDANGLSVDLTDTDIVAGPLANVISDVTATATEINQVTDGVSVNVTAANLNTIMGGAGSNADALHSHQNPAYSYIASEALTADQAVALLPVEYEFYSQLTDATINLGSSNTLRKYAVKFIPTVTSSTLTTMQFRAREAVNGATTVGDLTISIQPDSAGAPSGTPVANGTANAISQVTQRTWGTSYANRTATFAASPTLTAGTTYWMVWECAATDGTNFLEISSASAHNENYITTTRLTYDLDTLTWGSSSVNPIWFWFTAQVGLLGYGLVPTDANWGARTWNFKGFAKADTSIASSADVYYSIVPGLSLSTGLTYWLSATPGALTTTPPTSVYNNATEPTAFAYRVGAAISATELQIDTGDRRVIIYDDASLTATTTRKYVTWFKPELVRVDMYAIDGTDGGFSHGYTRADGAENVTGFYTSAAGAEGLRADTKSAYAGSSANFMQGVSSSLSKGGFTYTITETGAVTGTYFTIEVVG